MKNILVTGAAGFIGTNLCQRLVNDGHNVVGIDNKLCNSPLRLPKEVDLIQADVKDMSFIKDSIGDIDEIYHLASIASPKFYKKHPLTTIGVNVNGTIAMAELALSKNAKLLLTSTSEVYGDPKVYPQPESYNGNVNCLSDRACYDESKRTAETIMYEYQKRGLKAVVVRIFNTYGPGIRHDDGRMVGEFIWRLLHNEPVTVYNGGNQTRSLCYIDDTVEWLCRAMGRGEFGPFNIGNDTEMSINLILKAIAEIMNIEPKIINKKIYDGDPSRRCPDLTKTRIALGDFNKTPLPLGLSKTIIYLMLIKA